MQYCPSCKVQIRGKKACCPLCQREVITFEPEEKSSEAGTRAKSAEIDFAFEDPFAEIPRPPVSFMLMVRCVTFACVSFEIILGAIQIITGFRHGWIVGLMVCVLIGWVDFQMAIYYRNNLIRMLNVECYVIMLVCLAVDVLTGVYGWSVAWVAPFLFVLNVIVTFAAAKLQEMELGEYVLYPAFNVLVSLLQIIPIAVGINRRPAAAVISIAIMLILVSGLIIFKGKLLREAAAKYLHI